MNRIFGFRLGLLDDKILPTSAMMSRSLLLLMTVLLVLGVVGFFSYDTYNFLPSIFILEIVFLLMVFLVLKSISSQFLFFTLIAFFYVIFSFFWSVVLEGSNYFDFLKAYKAFFYIPMLSLFVGKDVFYVEHLKKLFIFLLFLFLIKYSYSLVLDFTPRMGSRPGLFVENNFELIFLILFFYLLFPFFSQKKVLLCLVLFVVFISGSRSAFLAFFSVCFFIYFRFSIKSCFALLLLSIIVIGLGITLFFERLDGGIEDIDRFRFALIFLSEVQSWPWWKFFLGAHPLTPLSPSSCEALSYYSSMYSYSGDGSCYSVILHSYVLRVIFDHGIFGFSFLLLFVWTSLNRSGYSHRQILCVISVLIISSLSVSSFNNIFVAISLAMYLGFFSYVRKEKST